LTFIISFTNFTAFAVHNHACYNTEILIKLLTFLFNVYEGFFLFFVTYFDFFIRFVPARRYA